MLNSTKSIMIKPSKYKYYYATSDFLILLFSFLLSLYLVQIKNNFNSFDFAKLFQPAIIIFVVFTILFITIFHANSLYTIHMILTKTEHLTALVKSILYGALAIILISLAAKTFSLTDSSLIIATFISSSLILLYIVRVEILRKVYEKIFNRNLLIVGSGIDSKSFSSDMINNSYSGSNIVGYLTEKAAEENAEINNKLILGNVTDLQNAVIENKVDEVIISIDNNYDELFNAIEAARKIGINVKVNSQLFDVVVKRIRLDKYGSIQLVDVSPHKYSLFSIKFKRVVDIIVALFSLILLSPFLLLISCLIKISSSGPVLFKQVRIGKDGKKFKLYKFRSMHVLEDEDEERKINMIDFMKNGNTHGEDSNKIINGNRLTKIGMFIRKRSIDELPQLINVIKGDMSLVGPRPCLPYEFENYEEWQKRRIKVMPGCTGVWQVTGRSVVSFNNSIILDLYYIYKMSPLFDLKLILKTIPVMLFARGGK